MALFDHRAKIIILNKDHQIALLNYTYNGYEKLVLPGGGVDYEDIESAQYPETSALRAAHRELREELELDYDEAADLIFVDSVITKPLLHVDLDIIERLWLHDRGLYNATSKSSLHLSFFIHVTTTHKPLLVNSLEIAEAEKDKMTRVVWVSLDELQQAIEFGYYGGTLISRDVKALGENILKNAPRIKDHPEQVNWLSLTLLRR